MVASEHAFQAAQLLQITLQVREADADDELQAAAWLRALSFGRYPEERKFAAEVRCCSSFGSASCPPRLFANLA